MTANSSLTADTYISPELVRGSERSCLRLSLGPAGALARSEVPFPDGADAHQGASIERSA